MRGASRRFTGRRSSIHYDIDTSVKALQHAIHGLFSTAALAGPNDPMVEDI
jgi:hypothetical protein